MSLRFVYGRSGSGKTKYCLDEIKSLIEAQAKNPLVLLVPEQASFQAEKSLNTALKAGGVLKTEVLSFQRMAFRIFNEVGGITYPHIHPAGKSMIVYRILDKMRLGFKIFSKSAEREGFVDTISTQITEFKRYSVKPEYLKDICGKLDPDHPLKDKLNDLMLIYSEFELILSERYRDSDDDLTLASRKILDSTIYNGAEIWIDSFTNFTPQEYKMIEALLKTAKRVTISLCTDTLSDIGEKDDTDVFAPVKRAYKRLVSLALKNKIDIEKSIDLNDQIPLRFKGSPELAHLEKNYNASPYEAYSGKTCDISLFSAVRTFSEIEAAARDIIGLCRDKNMRYRDIAVVTRDLSSYEKAIEVIFSEYGIPCFIDRKLDIANHPVVRLILSMLDIFNENWSYESVFRYLKTGLTNIEQTDIDRLENYVLACGIRGSFWTQDNDWRMLPELMPDEKAFEAQRAMLEDINRIRTQVYEPLALFRMEAKGKRTSYQFCSSLYDFLCNIGVPENIENCIKYFREKGELSLANEYSQVWNIVLELLDQTVEVMGEETFSLEKFSKIINIGFAQYKIGLIPASLDQVMVGSVERSKNHDIKALYILGANDGVFPSAQVKEGILSDQDRAALNNMGLELASDTRTQAFDEQYLVYRTLTAAMEYLRISWAISDSDGKTLRPSSVISRLRSIFPKITERSNILPSSSLSEEIELIAGKKPAFGHMVSSLRNKSACNDGLLVWENVYKWFLEEKDYREDCKKLRTSFSYKNLAQMIKGEKVRALYGDPMISSVSRLEKFTACPFAFYAQYGLGARERKIYRLSPPDIGTFLHAVVERFSRLVSKGDITWRGFDWEWCNNKVSEIIEEMLTKMQGTGIASNKRYTALASRLKRVVARAVWLISEHIRRSSFNPVDYEVGFGDREKYPPITIELNTGEKVNLVGRIDRVDAFKTEEGTYLRIIDYKSGAKDFKLSDVFYGLQLQLITYMDALWENGEKALEGSVLPAGMLYFKIDDPIIKGGSGMALEEIETSIMRQLKMKGLILSDVKLIKEMDNTIDGASMIIPATLNKGDVLGKNTSGATLDQFKLLRKYVKRLLKGICEEIMKGNVSISPYKKKGTTSCKFCSFLPICQFDTTTKDNTFKLLYDKNDEEVWKLV